MDWRKLDALGAELNARLQRGAFHGLPPVTLDGGHAIEAELMARIVLADIEHIRQWDHTHPTNPTGEVRLQAVGSEAQRLLQPNPVKRDATD